MNVLVVGGTGFYGGALTDAAKARGHQVAVLTRGITQRALPPEVECLVGDRRHDVSSLQGRAFDLVFDTCAYTPEHVQSLLANLEGRVGRYAMISSISVYDGLANPGLDERAPAPTATASDFEVAAKVALEDAKATAYGESYGRLKRAAEIEAQQTLGDQALLLRAGLLVGAGDASDRFTYWVRRMDQGGPVPFPHPPSRPIQVIDVRDAAEFAVLAAERGVGGVLNLTGPILTAGEVLNTIAAHVDSSAEIVWRDLQQFMDAGVEFWRELPLILPPGPELQSMMELSTTRAVAEGLTCRDLSDTVADVLAWDRQRRDIGLQAGMTSEQEKAVLHSE